MDVKIFGNYLHYRQRRQRGGGLDGRLALLDERIFKDRRILDVGCNTGEVAIDCARLLGAREVVGVDIDGELVSLARRQVRSTHSRGLDRQGPPFPACFSLLHGPLPMPRTSSFPRNVHFVHADYAAGGIVEDVEKDVNGESGWDTVLLLSVTKWIHLHHGDPGLKRLFRALGKILKTGGRLVLEAQPWSSYTKALDGKLGKDLALKSKDLHFRPDEFSTFLLDECGFAHVQRVKAHATGKGYDRSLEVYSK